MGIAEQNFVGVAVGLAALGFVPWLSSFTVFFTHRAIDPIRMLVAQTHANVKIGAAYAGLMTGLTIYGGLGGLVAEILSEALPRKVVRFGIEDCWGESAPNDYLLEKFQMSGPRLSDRIQKLVG
jgi:transketolase C-terminal domain/subunit